MTLQFQASVEDTGKLGEDTLVYTLGGAGFEKVDASGGNRAVGEKLGEALDDLGDRARIESEYG